MLRVIKLLAITLWIASCVIAAALFLRLGKPRLRDTISMVCYRGVLRIIGVHLVVRGSVAQDRPLIVVSNHVSYLDVVILGSVFPFRFTPKKEVSSWPGIASACRATGAVFVDRRPQKLREMLEPVRRELEKGEVVSLFPEATTGNGKHLLPFRSGFFEIAQGGVAVQPVAIAYTHIRRLPIDTGQWPSIAWYGDMNLVPHLWSLLGMGRIDVTVDFLPVIAPGEGGERKTLAVQSRHSIVQALAAARL